MRCDSILTASSSQMNLQNKNQGPSMGADTKEPQAMKHKRILAVAAVAAALAFGWFTRQVSAFPRLIPEQESYPLSAGRIAFTIRPGAHTVRFGEGRDAWLEYFTGQDWEKVPRTQPGEEVNFFALEHVAPPFGSVSAPGLLLESWDLPGAGTYRFILPCEVRSLLGGGPGGETLLASQSFLLQ